MPKTLLTALLGLLLLAGCDAVDASSDAPELVVEAFLFTDQPVDNIRVTEAIPLAALDAADSLEVPVNDATVTLTRDGVVFPLVSSGSDGFYHYAGTDLVVAEGDAFRLTVERGGTSIQARTVVPRQPESVALSSDEIEVIRLEIGPFGVTNPGGADAVRESLQNARISVTWDNTDADLHFVVVESLTDGAPDYILPEFVRDQAEQFRLVTEPTDLGVYDVDLRSMETFGDYQVIVYRVNAEYADLYDSREQDSRDLNEPASNIEGGLGVFSAFAGVVQFFEVVPE